jgi:hypothetical protein
MKNNDGRLAGILGTVIIHLVAGIIFMLFQIGSLESEYTEPIMVEIFPEEEPEPVKKPEEKSATTIEKIFSGDEEMLNIARNLANKSDEKIDPAKYQDMVKDELINAGKLGRDNYIDEQKRLKEDIKDEKLAPKTDNFRDSIKAAPKKPLNYQGPTRIYYDLKGRNHLYLPIPIYKCQGAGKVVLLIEVNQKGDVEKATVIASESTTSDECLIETAANSALLSRFNPDYSSAKVQTGTLSYQFVAQ